mgnify:CR=1 FL=1
MSDAVEFWKTLGWYLGRKATFFGMIFETGKGVVVEVLKARRGTYQKPFLHVGMVFLTVTVVMSAPIIVNSYPTSASSGTVLGATLPSAVQNVATDITNLDTVTKESDKPRRDVENYIVQGGDTLSSIAKKFSGTNNKLDPDSIAYLNDFSVEKVLKPGDEIKIPPVSGIVVKVKSGDTITSLAKKYGLPSSQAIVDWPYNSFVDDEKFSLAAGQILVIPGGKPPKELPQALTQVRTQVIFGTPIAGGSGQFSWPTNGVITQYFAWYHNGIDIANNIGTPILAADSGRVVSVLVENYGYGHHIIIDHGNGLKSLYAHLSEILVHVGDNVSRGQQIGKMGSTGRSTGSHLHFVVFSGNASVNPLGYLK